MLCILLSFLHFFYMCWDLSLNLWAGWITYKSHLKPIKMSEFLLCLKHCEMLIGIVFDLTAAWGCYCYWGVKLGSDLLVIVVRCISLSVNGVKMRMGLKRLGPFICSGCKVHYSLPKRDQKKGEKNLKSTAFNLANLSNMPSTVTRWVNPTTLVPLQIAVERTPSVAAQLLIDSKKLVGSLRS